MAALLFREAPERRQPGPPPPPGGRSGGPPIFNLPPATKWLAVALLAVHVIVLLLPPAGQSLAYGFFAFVPALFESALQSGEMVPLFVRLPTLVTHAFLHGDFMHLLLNGGFLLAFGSLVERAFGSPRFLLLFCFTAAVGALTELTWAGAEPIVMIGASGGVYGMMGAAAPLMFAGQVGRERRLALQFIAVVLGLNLLTGAFGVADLLAGASVAWRAHMGGFLAGLALALLWLRR